MALTIEQELETDTIEKLCPNFDHNCYANAKYRISRESETLGLNGTRIEASKRVEVLNINNQWQKHPVVFIHYGISNSKYPEGHLVIFLPDGKNISEHYNPKDNPEQEEVYNHARSLGLTQGNTALAKCFVREED